MFLFADLALPQAIPEWPSHELEEENQVKRTTTNFNATKDSGIEMDNFNSSLGNDTANLGVSPTTESRILLSFSNSVPTGDLVTNASLFITCGADPQNLTDIKIYPSRVKKVWYEENVTW